MRRIATFLLILWSLAACQAPPAATEPWSDREVLFVGLGDSVTAGFGASPGRSYYELLQADLRPVLPRLRTLNMSVSGSTSFGLLERQLAELPVQGPDVLGWVVVTTGGNDLIHNYGRTPPRPDAMYGATIAQAGPWIASFRQRLDTILEGIQSRFPGGCEIFLADIYDPTDGVGDIENAGLDLPAWPEGREVLASYNRILREAAARHPGVHPVDLHGLFMGHGIHNRQDYWYYANLEDPNDEGYEAIRGAFLERMQSVGAGLPGSSRKRSPGWDGSAPAGSR